MTSLRTRHLGEQIAAGDFIQAGEKRFLAIELPALVGQVIRDTRFAVLTYDPLPIDIAALAKNAEFPAKPECPPCHECGEPACYAIDDESRNYTDRGVEVLNETIHLCRAHYDEFRERTC
jgi:hypothetical protein